MQIRRQRIDGTSARITNRGQHLIAPDKQPRPRFRVQRRRGIARFGRGNRAAFRHPGINPAIQDRRIVKANRAHHPPNPRRPLRCLAGIEHHARAIPDATRRKPPRQIIRRRHGEVKAAGAVRKFALQIKKTRAGNMAGIVIFSPTFDAVGTASARFIQKIGGAIEDAERWVA